eukprot:m.83213 g.83213  ORF g.83213 m.83213 type:complete len:345 (+) comp12908_c0_seq2:2036-3070(+)
MDIWLDVDTGVDDAQALLLAFSSSSLNVRGVSCVAGNGTVDNVVKATAKILDVVNADKNVLFCRGISQPMIEPLRVCPQIHGVDSLGDLDPPLQVSFRKVENKSAVECMLDFLRSLESSITVVALGPLSNIAALYQIAPELCSSKIDKIFWMGGSRQAGGNASAWSEANAAYDPEAAHVVLSSDLPVYMYTWDMYLRVGFQKTELQDWGLVQNMRDIVHGGSENALAEEMSTTAVTSVRLLLRDMEHFKIEEALIGDAAVIASLICPDSVKWEKHHVAVELQGSRTRGMTVCDLRPEVYPPDEPKLPENVYVAVDLDASALKECFVKTVLFQKKINQNTHTHTQ